MTESRFVPLTYAELRSLRVPEPVWIVEGILLDRSLTLLSAREKAGKGLLTIDLLVSIAFGDPFLGRTTLRGPVVYCAAEEDTATVRERFEARVGDRADWAEAPIHVLPLNGFTEDHLRLHDPVGMVRLANMVAAMHPACVVLDTLRELHDWAEDSADEMTVLLRPLRQLAHETGVAMVVIVNHHQNKGNTFRGSTAILGAMDQEWAFHRDADDAQMRGRLTVRGRRVPNQVVPIRLREGLRWEEARDGAAAGTTGVTAAVRGAILAALAADPDFAGWLTIKDVVERGDLSFTAAFRGIKALAAAGSPPFHVRGTGKRGDPIRIRSLARGDATGPEEGELATAPRWEDEPGGGAVRDWTA